MRSSIRLSFISVVSIALAAGLSGCSSTFKRDSQLTEDDILLAQDGRTLWQAKLQYVKIVNQDVANALPNDQPISLTSDDLRSILQLLTVSGTRLFREVEMPLFSLGELQILGTAISAGLSQTGPNEDINFVSIGSHAGTLAKELKTTTGRVFVRDAKLNIIFGLVHQLYVEKDPITGQPIDQRLNPLLPGNRSSDSAPAIRVALGPGQAYYYDPETGKERTDWLVIDIATALAAIRERETDTTGLVAPGLLEDIARNKQQARKLRDDITNMKEIIFELQNDIDVLNKKIEASQKKP